LRPPSLRITLRANPTPEAAMPALHQDIDPNGLDEFSVVFTDRSLNQMSAKFQQVMRDITAIA
jgi:hypothetical protein